MPRWVAFLRAINVGGHNVKMEQLRALFEALDFSEVTTFIASGNVIFTASSQSAQELETQIEEHLKACLGYEVVTFIRTIQEVSHLASDQPFDSIKLPSTVALNLAFLKVPLTSDQLQILTSLKTDIDDFYVKHREIYWLCKKKQSESTFSNAVLEKQLKLRATLRSANTIAKIAAKYG